MLTPHLSKIKLKIERKSSIMRSKEEKELLLELIFIEQRLPAERTDLLFEKRQGTKFPITSGPSGGACPCCGR